MLELNFIPIMHEDEDIRSIVYRYYALSAHYKLDFVVNELFGVKNNHLSLFPRSIGLLISRIPGNHGQIDFEDFLFNHTYYPICRLISSSQNLTDMKQYLYNGINYNVFHSRYLEFVSKEIRYCAECLCEDYDTKGECYIHRLHQLNRLDICIKHKVKLISLCNVCKENLAGKDGEYQLAKPICTKCGESIIKSDPEVVSESEINLKLELLSEFESLLNLREPINKEIATMNYKAFAFKNGLLFNNGNFKKKEFVAKLREGFAGKCLDLLKIKRNFEDDHVINDTLEYTHNYSNICLHIIIIKLLCGSIKNFFSRNIPEIASIIPFGTGPWKCVNHYCKEDIYSCMRIYYRSLKLFSGRFECQRCKAIYSLKYDPHIEKIIEDSIHIQKKGHMWASKILEDSILENVKFSNSTIKHHKRIINMSEDYGQKDRKDKKYYRNLEWFKLMVQTYEETRRYTKTAKILKASIVTVKKYLKMYYDSNKSFEVFNNLKVSELNLNKRIETIKEKLILIIRNNPQKKRNEIIEELGSADHAVLVRHSKQWLESVLPGRLDYEPDWRELDMLISNNIKKEVLVIYYDEDPVYRIRKETILQKIPFKYQRKIRKYPDKLPITLKLLEQSIETVEDFQIRKIPQVASSLRKTGVRININNFLYKNIYKNASVHVIDCIKEYLKINS